MYPRRCFGQVRVTDDVSSEVVVPVDRVALLSAVLVHDYSPEVRREQLVVGPQVQSELPGNTQTHTAAFWSLSESQTVRSVNSDLCRASKLSSFST